MSCPDAASLQAWLEGPATPEEVEALRAHLPRCAECRELVLALRPDTPVDGAAHTLPAVAVGASGSSLARGDVLGRYEILDRLGAGGMGVVYAAYDPELDRKVALKLIRGSTEGGDTAARELQERLRREAQAMARVVHPNVTAVYDVGRQGQQVFVAMELVDGETMAQWLLRAPRSPAEICQVFVRAGQGLAAAHAAGLVHRDFKPNNVMIDRAGRVRVTDFGLARPSGSPESGRPSPSPALLDRMVTASGVLLGTPAYMAPEQLGRAAADARSDQFSFCVALYEALCGRRPFAGTDTDQLHQAILAHRIEPPARKVPRRLLRVIDRGLAAAPAARWPAMEPLLAELGRDVSSLRRRWLVAGALLALTALLLAPGLAARRDARLCRDADDKLAGVWDPARKQLVHAAFAATGAPYAEPAFATLVQTLDGYRAAWVGMRTEACEATRVRGLQSDAVLELRMACLDDRKDELAAEVAELAHADAHMVQRAVEGAAGLTPIATCANVKALKSPAADGARAPTAEERGLRAELDSARAMLSLGRVQAGVPIAERVRDRAHALGARRIEADALLVLGQLHLDDRQWKPADELLQQAAMTALAAHDDLVAARAWIERLRVIGGVQMQFERALEIERFARATLERVGPPRDQLALLELGAAMMYEEHDDLGPALEHARIALGLADEPIFRARVLEAIGTIYNRQGAFAEAVPQFDAALAILEQRLGATHPVYGAVLDLAANAEWGVGHHARAIEMQERSLAIQERALGSEHADVAYALGNLAISLKREHQLDRAIPLFRRSIAILERTMGPRHPDVAQTLGNLGRAFLADGKPAEDLKCQEEALAIATESLGVAHPDRGYYLDNIAEALLALHAPKRAVAPLEEAVRLHAAHLEDPEALARTRFMLAKALRDSGGDRTKAEAQARAARAVYVKSGEKDTVAEIDAWLAGARAR